MVDVDVDVEDTGVVAEEFEDAEDDVWKSMNQQGAQKGSEGGREGCRERDTIYVAEPAGFTFLCVMQTPCPVDCHIAFPSV